jgi:hypothetical protein
MSDDPRPASYDTLTIAFIWVPDGGRRPGYPWFEAGQMTLTAEGVAPRPEAAEVAPRAQTLEQALGSSSPELDREAGFGARESKGSSADRVPRYLEHSSGSVDTAARALRVASDPGAMLRDWQFVMKLTASYVGEVSGRGEPNT